MAKRSNHICLEIIPFQKKLLVCHIFRFWTSLILQCVVIIWRSKLFKFFNFQMNNLLNKEEIEKIVIEFPNTIVDKINQFKKNSPHFFFINILMLSSTYLRLFGPTAWCFKYIQFYCLYDFHSHNVQVHILRKCFPHCFETFFFTYSKGDPSQWIPLLPLLNTWCFFVVEQLHHEWMNKWLISAKWFLFCLWSLGKFIFCTLLINKCGLYKNTFSLYVYDQSVVKKTISVSLALRILNENGRICKQRGFLCIWLTLTYKGTTNVYDDVYALKISYENSAKHLMHENNKEY